MLQPALGVSELRTSPAGLAALQLIMLLIASQAAHSFNKYFQLLLVMILEFFQGSVGKTGTHLFSDPFQMSLFVCDLGGLYFSCQTRLLYNFTKFLKLSANKTFCFPGLLRI